jgi:hypothetical protein
MSVALDPHTFARLNNEVTATIGLTAVEISETYEENQEGILAQQEPIDTEA